MPELPEIAHLQRTLEPLLVGRTIRRVRLRRSGVVRNIGHPGGATRADLRALLLGETIKRIDRHGKELALVACSDACLCVHLGMSGRLWRCPPRARITPGDHVHCIWDLVGPDHIGAGRLVFRDPRRFGGLWTFRDREALLDGRWRRLGPDALDVETEVLRKLLAGTRRAIKAVLLDQRVLAGVGNIYADELLFRAQVHPSTPACALDAERCRRIARSTRLVLRQALKAGGSTIRDYRDAKGRSGTFASRHRVYGRAGASCVYCRATLKVIQVAQRTTVFCPQCQTPP